MARRYGLLSDFLRSGVQPTPRRGRLADRTRLVRLSAIPRLQRTSYALCAPLAAEPSHVRRRGGTMTVKRMDNVGIVVEDIEAAIEFFTELGLELEGRAPIEGDWADGVTGLRDMRLEIAMMRTP